MKERIDCPSSNRPSVNNTLLPPPPPSSTRSNYAIVGYKGTQKHEYAVAVAVARTPFPRPRLFHPPVTCFAKGVGPAIKKRQGISWDDSSTGAVVLEPLPIPNGDGVSVLPTGEYRGGCRREGLAEREARLTKELEEEKEGAAAARGGEGEGGEEGGGEEPRCNTKKERELLAVRVSWVSFFCGLFVSYGKHQV